MEVEEKNETTQVAEEVAVDEETVTEEETDGKNPEFEYDDEGNIVIPDLTTVFEKDENAEEDKKDGEGEKEPEGDAKKTVEEDQPEKEASKDTEQPAEEPEKDVEAEDWKARFEKLQKEYDTLRDQAKDTLTKIGADADGDPMKGLAKLAAEADETTLEEYEKKRDEAAKEKETARQADAIAFEAKMKKDLAEIQSAYPETAKYKTMRDLPNIEKVGRFIDAGLTPKEAYIAANPDLVRQAVAESVKKQEDTKAHLRSSVPKGASDDSVRMTQSEYDMYEQLFPNLTRKQIFDLYKKTK